MQVHSATSGQICPEVEATRWRNVGKYERNPNVIDREGYCLKCGALCDREVHHVTYEPPQLAPLCVHCHRAVSDINAHFGVGRIDNETRLKVWQRFIGEPCG